MMRQILSHSELRKLEMIEYLSSHRGLHNLTIKSI
jgi:hypothetical protein